MTDTTDIEELAEKTKTVWQSFKKIFSLLKERKWFAAFKESFSFLRIIYVNHLKGKYFVIKGVKTPRTLIAVPALAVAYLFFAPSAETPLSGEQSIAEAENVKKASNTYDKDGIKVYDMHKCEDELKSAACGTLENYGENNFEKVSILVTFYAPEGTAIYEGGAVAKEVEARTRMKFTIPCPDEFSYFQLKEVSAENLQKTAENTSEQPANE